SSIDRTCQIQNPATNSFASAKGPSVTERLVPLKWIRFPNLLGLSPSPASMIPALISSSLNFPICSNICSAPFISRGWDSASDSLVAFTITMTRIGPPLWLGAALVACSIQTSFGGTGSRHHQPRSGRALGRIAVAQTLQLPLRQLAEGVGNGAAGVEGDRGV